MLFDTFNVKVGSKEQNNQNNVCYSNEKFIELKKNIQDEIKS